MAHSNSNIEVEVTATLESASIDKRGFWLDLLDRTVKTYIQNVLVFLGAGVVITDVSWTTVLSSAGLAALVSFLLALASATALTSGNWLIDTGDRAARTFAGTLVGAVPATGGLTDIDWRAALTIAGTAALVSVLTSALTVNLGASKGLPTTAPVTPALGILGEVETEPDDATGSHDDIDGI